MNVYFITLVGTVDNSCGIFIFFFGRAAFIVFHYSPGGNVQGADWHANLPPAQGENVKKKQFDQNMNEEISLVY